MPHYDTSHDGRALARRLAELTRDAQAARRVVTGLSADPTPPPSDVDPGTLTRHLMEARR